MNNLLVVRHGQASFGAADYDELSPLGHRQSEQLGAWLGSRQQKIDSLYVGPAKRHRQTAEALANGYRSCGLAFPLGWPAHDCHEIGHLEPQQITFR